MEDKIKKKSHLDKLIIAIYFLCIALPIYSANKIESYFELPIVKLNIMQGGMILVLVFIIIQSRGKISYRKSHFPMLITAAIFLLYAVIMFFWGKSKGYSYAIREMEWILFPVCIFFLIAYLVKKGFSFIEFMNITFYAMTVSLSITILMYFTQSWSIWGAELFLGTRFGGNYLTVLIITFTYGFYNYYNKTCNLKMWVVFFHLGMALFCQILAQSRGNLILTVLPSAFIMLNDINNRDSNRKSYSKLLLGAVVAVAVLFFGWKLLNSNAAIASRLNRADWFGQNDTFMIRIYTGLNGLIVFSKNPFGAGLGVQLYEYSAFNAIKTGIYYCDNVFITIAAYGGIVLIATYVLMFIIVYSRMLKTYKKTNNKLYIDMLFAFSCFVLSGGMLSAQFLHGFAVSMFLWSFFAISLQEYRKE